MAEPDKTEYVASEGGYNIFTATWRPRGDPKAVMHIVHGYGEHSMRYKDVAAKLVEEGYLVYAHDHFGKRYLTVMLWNSPTCIYLYMYYSVTTPNE